MQEEILDIFPEGVRLGENLEKKLLLDSRLFEMLVRLKQEPWDLGPDGQWRKSTLSFGNGFRDEITIFGEGNLSIAKFKDQALVSIVILFGKSSKKISVDFSSQNFKEIFSIENFLGKNFYAEIEDDDLGYKYYGMVCNFEPHGEGFMRVAHKKNGLNKLYKILKIQKESIRNLTFEGNFKNGKIFDKNLKVNFYIGERCHSLICEIIMNKFNRVVKILSLPSSKSLFLVSHNQKNSGIFPFKNQKIEIFEIEKNQLGKLVNIRECVYTFNDCQGSNLSYKNLKIVHHGDRRIKLYWDKRTGVCYSSEKLGQIKKIDEMNFEDFEQNEEDLIDYVDGVNPQVISKEFLRDNFSVLIHQKDSKVEYLDLKTNQTGTLTVNYLKDYPHTIDIKDMSSKFEDPESKKIPNFVQEKITRLLSTTSFVPLNNKEILVERYCFFKTFFNSKIRNCLKFKIESMETIGVYSEDDELRVMLFYQPDKEKNLPKILKGNIVYKKHSLGNFIGDVTLLPRNTKKSNSLFQTKILPLKGIFQNKKIIKKIKIENSYITKKKFSPLISEIDLCAANGYSIKAKLDESKQLKGTILKEDRVIYQGEISNFELKEEGWGIIGDAECDSIFEKLKLVFIKKFQLKQKSSKKRSKLTANKATVFEGLSSDILAQKFYKGMFKKSVKNLKMIAGKEIDYHNRTVKMKVEDNSNSHNKISKKKSKKSMNFYSHVCIKRNFFKGIFIKKSPNFSEEKNFNFENFKANFSGVVSAANCNGPSGGFFNPSQVDFKIKKESELRKFYDRKLDSLDTLEGRIEANNEDDIKLIFSKKNIQTTLATIDSEGRVQTGDFICDTTLLHGNGRLDFLTSKIKNGITKEANKENIMPTTNNTIPDQSHKLQGEKKIEKKSSKSLKKSQIKSIESPNFRLGAVTGEAEIRYFDNSVYKGETIFGAREGKGKLEYHNGEQYIGEWSQNYKHGYGKYKWTNGDFYEGEFKMGRITGFGLLMLATGDRLEGDFVNGNLINSE